VLLVLPTPSQGTRMVGALCACLMYTTPVTLQRVGAHICCRVGLDVMLMSVGHGGSGPASPGFREHSYKSRWQVEPAVQSQPQGLIMTSARTRRQDINAANDPTTRKLLGEVLDTYIKALCKPCSSLFVTGCSHTSFARAVLYV